MSELTQLRPSARSRFRPAEDWFVHSLVAPSAQADAPMDGGGKFTEVGAWSGAGLRGNGVAQAGLGGDAGLDPEYLESLMRRLAAGAKSSAFSR